MIEAIVPFIMGGIVCSTFFINQGYIGNQDEIQHSFCQKQSHSNKSQTFKMEQILDAICVVESNCDSTMVGLDGEIGAYQILPAYWKDAVEFDPTIGGNYRDVLNDVYARRIIRAYWTRYATERRLGHPPTPEDLARTHNGGPMGYKKQATIKYWEKVRKAMND